MRQFLSLFLLLGLAASVDAQTLRVPNQTGNIGASGQVLTVQYTPGAGLSALSNKQVAVARLEAVRSEVGAIQLNIEAQLKSTLTELDAMADQLEPAHMLLQGAAEVVESYLRQYQIGRKNWLDVLNAQREKTNALYNLADMQYGLQQAQVRLMLQTGELRSDALTAIHD